MGIPPHGPRTPGLSSARTRLARFPPFQSIFGATSSRAADRHPLATKNRAGRLNKKKETWYLLDHQRENTLILRREDPPRRTFRSHLLSLQQRDGVCSEREEEPRRHQPKTRLRRGRWLPRAGARRGWKAPRPSTSPASTTRVPSELAPRLFPICTERGRTRGLRPARSPQRPSENPAPRCGSGLRS